jgi:hypothetical protein
LVAIDHEHSEGHQARGVPFDMVKGQARWLWFPAERLGIDVGGVAHPAQ